MRHAAILTLGFGLMVSPAHAQGIKDQLVGSWSLVSITAERDGQKSEPWGGNPEGVLVMNGNGRFSQIQMRADRKHFAVNNRLRGTDEENKTMAQGVLAYYGTYAVDETSKVLTFTIEASSFPNFKGTTGKRQFTLSGNTLTIANAAPAGGAAIQLVWRRE